MVTSTIGPGYDALTPQQKSRIAFMRFGLGPRPGGPAQLSKNADAALQALRNEIASPNACLIDENKVLYRPGDDGSMMTDKASAKLSYAPTGTPLTYEMCCRIGRSEAGSPNYSVMAQERVARLRRHLSQPVGFTEQLVIFWSNHFSVCHRKGPLVKATVGNMEREAIRPYVLGNFSDMLKAVVRHPAMIWYLDNNNSTGPNSVVGSKPRSTRSYNENLAREILELHTVGFDGGYSQTDVTTLSKIITGWTTYPPTSDKIGQYYFEPTLHEPADKYDGGVAIVMQREFPQEGEAQGLAVLDMLAAHENTARHIARKMLQHFVCDDPQQADIDHLAHVFTSSGGNLRDLANAILEMDVAWATPLNRLRQPYPWMVSILRGMGVTGVQLNDRPQEANDNLQANVQALLTLLDQGVWSRTTPDGFPPEDYNWLTPNTVRLRKDAAGALINAISKLVPYTGSPGELAKSLLCGGVSDTTAAALSSLGKDPRPALAMLFVTPEFMRR